MSLNFEIYFLKGSCGPWDKFQWSLSDFPFSMSTEYCIMKVKDSSSKLLIVPDSNWVNQRRDWPDIFSEKSLQYPVSSSWALSSILHAAIQKAARWLFRTHFLLYIGKLTFHASPIRNLMIRRVNGDRRVSSITLMKFWLYPKGFVYFSFWLIWIIDVLDISILCMVTFRIRCYRISWSLEVANSRRCEQWTSVGCFCSQRVQTSWHSC